MSVSPEWDKAYQSNTHISVWPWSDLISLVMRMARPEGRGSSVCELGCGAGANIPFFLSLEADYYAVEGSQSITERLWERFPEQKDKIKVGDFTKEIPFSKVFDLIVDRGSITHNSSEDIARCLDNVYSKLKTNGKFIGVDWFSASNSYRNKGERVKDDWTETRFADGPFKGIGLVHFFDKPHLLDFFSKFKVLYIEHKEYRQEFPPSDYVHATWSIVAEKI